MNYVQQKAYQIVISSIFFFIIGFIVLGGDEKCKAEEIPLTYSYPFGVFNDQSHNGQLSLDYAIELGNQISRQVLPWWLIEPEKGIFQTTLVDTAIDMHYDGGIALLITLNCNSSWATRRRGGPDTQISSPPLDMEDYENFVRTVVERYKGKVKYWQIENEVFDNTLAEAKYWDGTKEEYIDLLHHAYTTIKEADSNAKVVLAGFADILLQKAREGDPLIEAFFHYLMDKGRDYFDVIDCHQYYSPEGISPMIDMIKKAMNTYGYQKELICTEAGDLDVRLFADHPDLPIIQSLLAIPEVSTKLDAIKVNGITEGERIDFNFFLKKNKDSRNILEEFQAENLVKRVCLTLSLGVTQIQWLCMEDSDNPIDWYHASMCLIDSDGREKPHYYTYKLLIDMLDNFISVYDMSPDSNKRVIRFDFADKDSIYILWSNTQAIIDLSEYISRDNMTLHHIITELDNQNEPIISPSILIPTKSIPINKTPILVTTDTIKAGDINDDGKVNVLDVQTCVNVVLRVEAREKIVIKAKQVAEPLDVCDVLDLQTIVNIILTKL